jgi:hypothetical protein
MTAAAEDRNTTYNRGEILAFPVKAATKIYNGTLVCVDSTGYAIPAADTSGNVFVGVACEHADNSAGAAGAISVQVRRRGVFEFAAAGLAIANTGADLYAADDQTVQLVANNVRVGRLAVFDSATNAPVEIDPISLQATPGETTFTIDSFFPGAVGHTEVTVKTFELPRAFQVLRGYANAKTAPGASYNCTVKVTDGTTPQTWTIAGAAVAGEDEAINQAYAANTDITISLQDDDASGNTADVNVTLVCQFV